MYPSSASRAARRRQVALLALVTGLGAVALALAEPTGGRPLAHEKRIGEIELVAIFDGPMPTGVTVSHDGRIFVNFPRWGDKVEYTVAEVKGGKTVPYPDAATNHWSKDRPGEGLLSVQSVVVDPKNRLWCLDTGSVKMGAVLPGAAKLLAVDLTENRVVKKITFPPEVATLYSYLNDVRFDLRRGKEGMAFISDSSEKGPNGIVVVDLASGKSWRRLNNHPSTRPEENFLPLVEGKPLMKRPEKGKASHLQIGSDGIAISHDGERLYYCPLASRRLYSVSVHALADPAKSDAEVAQTVVDHGDKGGGADGLESDDKGRIYLSNYEHNAIVRRLPEGRLETLVSDPRVLWPDTLSVATDGHLYFTANQLHRQAQFHQGKDLRQKPYCLFRVRIDAGPVLLK
jgi:sugar lactone lactonase YvrE